jgi:hypothetical protein
MDDHENEPGFRKDGKPHRAGNTREDGSFKVGRERPPEHTRFAVGDGRKRGGRTKGTKNLATDWAEELAERITIHEGGKPKRVTKQRGLVKSTVSRAMKSSDRAAETAFRHAAAERGPSTGLALSDSETIQQWLAQQTSQAASDPLDDHELEAAGSDASDDQ